MTTQALVSRAHGLIDRLEAWAHGSRTRSLLCKVFVTLVGPLVVLTGIAMTVLPGPGLVVVALGLALLALEYQWARTALRLMGRVLTRARDTALPKDGARLQAGDRCRWRRRVLHPHVRAHDRDHDVPGHARDPVAAQATCGEHVLPVVERNMLRAVTGDFGKLDRTTLSTLIKVLG